MTNQPAFPLLGEPLALDLVNTHILRRGSHVDLLGSRAALTAWLRAQRGRVAWRGRADAADLAAVTALRDAADALLRARLAHAPAPQAALRRFNRVLATPPARARLEWTSGGPRKALPSAGTQRDTLLRTLALDALEVLTGTDAPLLRQCAHPNCRLLFVARNRRRRWCSGATCGNRARVARHDAGVRRDG